MSDPMGLFYVCIFSKWIPGKSSLPGFYDICRWRVSQPFRAVLEGFLRSGAAGPHLPFVKAELKVYPHRKESVSQDGCGLGSELGQKALHLLGCLVGLTVGCGAWWGLRHDP